MRRRAIWRLSWFAGAGAPRTARRATSVLVYPAGYTVTPVDAGAESDAWQLVAQRAATEKAPLWPGLSGGKLPGRKLRRSSVQERVAHMAKPKGPLVPKGWWIPCPQLRAHQELADWKLEPAPRTKRPTSVCTPARDAVPPPGNLRNFFDPSAIFGSMSATLAKQFEDSASIASCVQMRATSGRISRTRELGADSAHCRHSAARSLHFSGLSIAAPSGDLSCSK